jgi:hypothetical protein
VFRTLEYIPSVWLANKGNLAANARDRGQRGTPRANEASRMLCACNEGEINTGLDAR